MSALAVAIAAPSAAVAQTAYFSTQGTFTATSATQDFFVDLTRSVTSAETLRFETFSSRGTTPNAAGDTSPTSPTAFDSLLALNTPGGTLVGSNDDGAAGFNLDALLSWPGVADSGGTLGTGPLAAGTNYRLRLAELNNETGPWGVDLVGPANALKLRDFRPGNTPTTPSTVGSIKFGTNGTAAVGSAEAHAIFSPTILVGGNYVISGGLVVAQTGNASFIMDDTDFDVFTVNGATTVKLGGDITLLFNSTFNANGVATVDGGELVLRDTARLNLGLNSELYVQNGGRVDVNAGTTLSAPDVGIKLGETGNATLNQLNVTNGTVTTRSGTVGFQSGSNSRAVIDGASATWTMTNDLYVGRVGSGTLEVKAGGKVSNRDGLVGYATGGVGTITLTGAGSTWTSTRNLSLGDTANSGVGTLTVSTNGRLNVGDGAAAATQAEFSYVDDVSANASDGGLLSVYNGSNLTVSTAGGLSVGVFTGHGGRVLISGATSQVNVSNATAIGNAGNGVLDVVAGGAFNASRDVDLGVSNTGRGVVTVDGTGSRLAVAHNLTLGSVAGNATPSTLTVSNNARLFVGDNGAAGTPNGYSNVDDASANASDGGLLTVRSGATLNVNTSGLSVGQVGGHSGKLVVTGTGSTANVQNLLFIGVNGSGVLDVNAAGRVTAGNSYVGLNTGSVGTATLAGAGSIWTSTGELRLGDSTASGVGTLTINSNARLNVGDGAAAYTFADYSVVDDTSPDASAANGGLLSVYNGSTLTNNTTGLEVGYFAGHSGRVLVSGSTVNAGFFAIVGNHGAGVLDVQAGGSFNMNADLLLGFDSSGRGVVTVDGTNSRLTARGNVVVGSVVGNPTPSSITLTNGGQLLVGDAAGDNVPNGIDISDADPIANNAGGLLNIRGTVTALGNVLIGREAGASGRLLVTGNGSTLTGSTVFVGNRGRGDARLEAGGDLIAVQIVIGAENTSDGSMTVTGTGSTASASFLDLGTSKTGALTVADSGVVSVANRLLIGGLATGIGTLAVTTNGLVDVKGDLIVGQLGRGDITVGGVGIFAGGRVRVGDGPSLTGGRVDIGDTDLTGNNGGNLRLANASTFTTEANFLLGEAANRFGRIAVASNSMITTTNSFFVGSSGVGRIEITTGGRVNGNTMVLGGNTGGNGGLTLSGSGSLVDLNDDLLVGGSGVGTVNLGSGAGILVGDAATGTSELVIADLNLAGNAGGNVIIRNGSTLTMNDVARIAIPANTYGRLAVDGAGSSFTKNSGIILGGAGTGVLDVTAGGRVTLNGTVNGTALSLGNGAGGRGTVTVDGTGSVLTVKNNVAVGNATVNPVSTLTVRNGGALLVGDLAVAPASPGPIRIVVADGTLDGSTGGVIDVRAGSLLDATGGDVVLANAASSFGRINVTGANARLRAANVAIGGPGRGQLDIAGGDVLLTNSLSIVGVGSQLNLSGGVLTVPTITASGGGFNFTGGRLVDTRNFIGSLTQNGGTLAPFGLNSEDVTAILGNYTLNGGTIESQIGPSFDDVLFATSTATLNNANLALITVGYSPVLGNQDILVSASSIVGRFTTVSGVQITPTRSFAITYTATDVSYTVALPGDATLSSGVEFNDLLALAKNYNGTGKTWVQGDFNGTGTVDFDDLLILAKFYGQTGAPVPAGAFSADFAAEWAMAQSLVPEPALIALLPVAALARRRRRHS